MYQGNTPTLTFNIKNNTFDMSNIQLCHITIRNENGVNQTVYTEPTVDTENKKIVLELTQKDTLKFNEGNLYIQIRLKVNDKITCNKNPIVTTMKEIYEREEI